MSESSDLRLQIPCNVFTNGKNVPQSEQTFTFLVTLAKTTLSINRNVRLLQVREQLLMTTRRGTNRPTKNKGPRYVETGRLIIIEEQFEKFSSWTILPSYDRILLVFLKLPYIYKLSSDDYFCLYSKAMIKIPSLLKGSRLSRKGVMIWEEPTPCML